MTNPLRLLIVDDHPMIVLGYRSSIEHNNDNQDIQIDEAYSCKDAYAKVLKAEKEPYDIVFLDINLPASPDIGLFNGEDLGFKIRKLFPKTKILVLTMLADHHRMHGILKNLSPEGFLIKSEITPSRLYEAVQTLQQDDFYYGKKAKSLMRKHIANAIHIEEVDRKILYYLSIGEKMKDLPKYIPLSMPTIERRKKRLKLIFGIPEGNDRQLLFLAKEKGFV